MCHSFIHFCFTHTPISLVISTLFISMKYLGLTPFCRKSLIILSRLHSSFIFSRTKSLLSLFPSSNFAWRFAFDLASWDGGNTMPRIHYINSSSVTGGALCHYYSILNALLHTQKLKPMKRRTFSLTCAAIALRCSCAASCFIRSFNFSPSFTRELYLW